MACGPRRKERRGACGGRTPGVRVAHAREMTPTGGARLSAVERGRERRRGLGREKLGRVVFRAAQEGMGWFLGCGGEKEKKEGESLGWAEKGWGEGEVLHF